MEENPPLKFWKEVENPETKEKAPTLVDYTSLAKIAGLNTLNGIIENTNNVSDQFFTEVKNPIYKKKLEILRMCELEEVPYAHMKHALLGSVLRMAVECTMSVDDIKKSFIFKEESPYFEFIVPEKYKELYAKFLEWISLYAKSLTKLEFLVEELEKIPQ